MKARSRGTVADAAAPAAFPERLWVWVTWGSVSAWAIALFAVKCYQWSGWLVSAWDMGIYMSGLASLSRGDPRGWSSFIMQPVASDASQWILYLLAPIFWLTRHYGMFALQAAALALGLVPFALFARERWRSPWWALAVPVAVAIHPSYIATALWDWHPDTLAFCFMAWALWADHRSMRSAYWTLVVLTLLTKNQAVVPIAALGLARLVRDAASHRRFSMTGAATVLVALALFLTGQMVVLPWIGAQDSTVAANYGYLGGSPPQMLASLATHPAYLVDAVLGHPGYWLLVLGDLAFLPLLDPLAALPGLAVLVVNGLSRVPLLSNPFSQYPLWALPFLAWAAVSGVARLSGGLAGGPDRAAPGPRKLPRGVGTRAAPAAGVALFAASLTLLVTTTMPAQAWRLGPVNGPVARSLTEAERLVPAHAVVYGQSGTSAHFYDRTFATAEPYYSFHQLIQEARHVQTGHVYVVYAAGRGFGPIIPASRQHEHLAEILALTPFDLIYRENGVTVYRSVESPSRIYKELFPGAPSESSGAARDPR